MITSLLVITSIYAQSGPIDLDHPIYPWLVRQAALGKIPQNWTGIKPISWSQVNQLLGELDGKVSNLSPLDRKLMRRFQAEFHLPVFQQKVKAPWQPHYWATTARQIISTDIYASPYPHSMTFNDSIASIWADWDEEFRFQNNGTFSRGYYTDRLTFHGQVNQHFSFFWDFIQYRISNVSKFPDLPPEYKQGHIIDQYQLDWYVWSLSQGGLYSQFKNWSLSIAQQPVYWGFSPKLSPILNTNVLPYSYINFTVDYKIVHFSNLQAGLLAESPNESKKEMPDKRMSAQRMSVDFTPNLTLSFNEFEIYSRRSFEPGYLVPIIFYWAQENTLGDRDNLLMAVDGVYRVTPGFQIYGTFFWDELDWFALSKDSWKNKFAPQIGMYWILPTSRFSGDFRLEYSQVHPWTYTHDDTLDTFTSAHTGLGFPYGPNSATLDAQTNLWLSPRLSVSVNWLWLRKGSGFGSDVNDNYADRDTLLDNSTTLLMGTIHDSYSTTLDLRFRVNTMLELSGNYTHDTRKSEPDLIQFAVRFDW